MHIVRQKVLVVDDDPLIREMILTALERNGLEGEAVENGERALALVKTMHPHIIVLDRRMPILDGTETLKRLKNDEEIRDIPVIMLTGDNDISQVMESLDLGACEYVVKPFAPEDLIIRLKVVLKSGGIRLRKKPGEDLPER